jgi:hypothetical protein
VKRKIIVRKKPKPVAGRSTIASLFREDFSGRPTSAEMSAAHKRVEGAADHYVRGLWKDLINPRASIEKAPLWLLRLGIEYAALIEGYSRTGSAVSPVVLRRFKYCTELDAAALKRESEFLVGTYDSDTTEAKTGGITMAAKVKDKRSGKERRSDRVTAGSVLIRILSLAKVPGDESIIETVRKETGSKLFDEKQLAWYKWKYRQGKLKGQDGKKHVIAQGSPLKAKAPKAEAKKRKVIVRKKAKEAVEA